MSNGKFAGYISNHPFIFLTGLALVVGCFGAGILFLSGSVGIGQVQSTPTAASTATAVRTATAIRAPLTPTATITLAPTESAAPLVVTFVDVGQGEAILIVTPEGQTVLIDGGSAGSGALAYLQGRGIRSIDIMIATNHGEEHIGGLIEVLDAMPVRKVITNAQSDTSNIYLHFLDAIASAKAEYEEVERGDTISLGSLAFTVLSPAAIRADNLKMNSLVLRMSHGKTGFLFMGDADRNAESGILAANLPLQADILKIGNHGSCASSSPAFLDAVHPVVAIYSAGINNPYNVPCAATLSALGARGILIYGTDTNGSITVTVTMDQYAISSPTGLLLRK